jgi:hypothetical protein
LRVIKPLFGGQPVGCHWLVICLRVSCFHHRYASENDSNLNNSSFFTQMPAVRNTRLHKFIHIRVRGKAPEEGRAPNCNLRTRETP